MSKEKKNNSAKGGFWSTIARWGKRIFFGGSRQLSQEEMLSVEKIESPSVMTIKAFFRRKLAVAALIVLVLMFLFVFIGPYFFQMDLTYTDPLQANMAPISSLATVPRELMDNVRDINGFADFTVGVDNDNNFYIWGNTKNNLTGIDYSELPAEIQPGKIAYAAAGSDHIIAITTDGKVVGWGNSNNGQYGIVKNPDDPYTQMPDIILNGTIDPNEVSQLICGYQCTAIVMKDGTMYMWGNNNSMLSLKEFIGENYSTGIKKVALSNYYGILLREDGSVTGGQSLTFFGQTAVSSKDGNISSLDSYISKHKAKDVVATNNCYAILLEDGSIVVFGSATYGEKDLPENIADVKFKSIHSGTRHFVAVAEDGTVYAWGHNDGGQCDVAGEKTDLVFTGAKQTYLASNDSKVTKSVGFKGYLMGTDNMGRDVLTRIVHGGKMTMTIGAVAVIVSTVIAIIVGCLSGYFGGWIDMLLMRITEICSSIPFLPFAMMLSYVIRTMPIPETTRIFIIMIMLGLLSWPGLARMIRAQVLAEREKEFVVAAQAMGVKERIIAFKHILPNVISVILVSVTLDFAGCMLTESSLSYLGFGVQQPQPTWGNMLNGANNSLVIQNYWWQWVFPSIFLAVATISINIIGDTLRDVLDPKSTREK